MTDTVIPSDSSTAPTHKKAGNRRTRRPKQSTETTLFATAARFVPGTVTPTTDASESDRSRSAPRPRPRRSRPKNETSHRPPRNNLDELRAARDVNDDAGVLPGDADALINQLKEADTITERLQHSLKANLYECCICCDTIKRHQPVFEDQNCWAVFHLSCISKWAKKQVTPENGIIPEGWRCPACNSANTELPGVYTCWCTKELEPEVSRMSPHSCGQTCGKLRSNNCPHPCSLPCHPGPCSPCTSLGPQQQCFCGRNSSQRRCVDTDYLSGAWACQEVCEELLPCDIHTCERTCHPGLCGACTVLQDAVCFCGQETRAILCSALEDVQPGVNKDREAIQGRWQCANKCDKPYDCGIHKCSQSCHTKSSQTPSQCPLSPMLVSTCQCGQTQLDDLLSTPRSSCSDPIPVCHKICSKSLPCGHQCKSECHIGSCSECTVEMDILCQCGTSQVSTTCQDMQLGLQPSCDRVCRTSLSCARHICQNRCCSGLLLAQDRISQRPKGRQAALLAARHEEIEAEHLCTRPCGRSLTCGNHSCGVLCHSGPCPTCLVASFDDLSCHCGRTSIAAPIACGTSPPPCKHPCTRRPPCGHPAVPHNCHLDHESCPRCPYLVERLCMCTKQMVKNQSCWKTNVSCGQICNEPLKCGNHKCLKRCHLQGECENPCQQTCGKARSGCGHPCGLQCHDGDCPQDASHPCEVSVMASCACGSTRKAVRCNSQDADPTTQSTRFLKCTDFCAIIERNKKLSAALGVTEDHKVLESNLYEESTIDYYRENRIWCSTIEQSFRTFLSSPDKLKNFKPMKAELRQFVHEMAEAYRMKSEAMDDEPKRSVQIQKTEHTVPPQKSLAQASLAKTPATTATTTSTTTGEQAEKKRGQAYNAFVLVSLRFGTTQGELKEFLKTALETTVPTSLVFDVQITEDGEYGYLRPQESELSTEQVEIELSKLRSSIRQAVTRADVANSAELCWIDRNGEMAYRESRKNKGLNLYKMDRTTKTRNVFDALSLE